jgi:hypothetical protein
MIVSHRILANLDRIRAAGHIPAADIPTPWQLSLGVLRMWHRILFRSDTVGTSPGGRVRGTWRARLLHLRALRLPFLLAEGAVVPLDLTGLASSPERLFRHLLGAHHDQHQFAYDLEILAAYGRLADLRAAVLEVIEHDTPRSRWLRDLTVFEGYHESLLAAVDCALAGDPALTEAEATDPDISFGAYLRWCARQPATPGETVRAWREGRFALDSSLVKAGASDAARELVGASQRELARRFAAGHRLDPAALDGWRYRGISLGLPRWVDRLTWSKFAKTFARDSDGRLRGWNTRIIQDGLDRPWRPMTRGGRPVDFGFFDVAAAPGGVTLDYASGGGALSRLRDPLVSLHPGSSELLLGRSLVAVGRFSIPTPSYFVLERDRRL